MARSRQTRAPSFATRQIMANFTPVSAAIGGALIGLAAVLLMLFTGRIAGISGIAGGLFNPRTDDRLWRVAFIAGLILAPLAAALLGHPVPMPQMPGSMITVAVAGLLVGFGTRLGNGCTSGHGICGIARLSPRSIVATLIFMIAAIIVVALTHHVIGG
ncbi:MAG: YeeE/YedE family protein [Xanthobacteraceae bacterium]